MLRILKYFKPFTPLIVAAIILLFIQANADLALPDYMSQIVNIGIQQGGIEHAVPEAIRYSQMQRVLLFLEPGQRTELLNLYRLIDEESPDYTTYLDRIPGLSEEPVYVLEQADDAVLAQLDPVVGKAILIVAGIEQMTTQRHLRRGCPCRWSNWAWISRGCRQVQISSRFWPTYPTLSGPTSWRLSMRRLKPWVETRW